MRKPDDCVYNSMIECQPGCRNCVKCGWNPVVEESRLQEIRQAFGCKSGS